MRGWLALRYVMGKDGFEEILVNLSSLPCNGMLNRSEILKFSPSGKAPALIDNGLDVTVYESVAICFHLADRFPSAGLLPANPAARGLCLSACVEMHSGFTALRTYWPHNCLITGLRHGAESLKRSDVREDIHRLGVLWTELITRFSSLGGPYLFGHFSAADCMYAPVAVRFYTYDPTLHSLANFPLAQQYVHTLYNTDMVQEWIKDAKKEGPSSFLRDYESPSDNYDARDFS